MIALALTTLSLSAAGLILLLRSRTARYVHRRFRSSHRLLLLLRTAYAVTFLLTVLSVLADSPRLLDVAVAFLLLVLVAQPAALLLMIPVVQHSDPQSVLVVAAHPDDLEIAVGGTLAKFVDRGHQVHALVMSHGAAGGDAGVRPYEAQRGADFLGLTSLTVLNLPDRRLEVAGPEMIDAIESQVGEASMIRRSSSPTPITTSTRTITPCTWRCCERRAIIPRSCASSRPR